MVAAFTAGANAASQNAARGARRLWVKLGKAHSEQMTSAIQLPAQPIDATQALNLSAGVSNCKVSRGRSLS